MPSGNSGPLGVGANNPKIDKGTLARIASPTFGCHMSKTIPSTLVGISKRGVPTLTGRKYTLRNFFE